MLYVVALLLGVLYGLLLESVGVTIHQNPGKFLLFILIPFLFAVIVAVACKQDKKGE